VHRQAELAEIVLALHPASRFASGLDRGQEQRDEHADDGDYNQKLDKRECRPEARERPIHCDLLRD
jgi:hypothetical protein